jgi:hypothetical protein
MATIVVSAPAVPTQTGPGYATAFLLSPFPAATDLLFGQLLDHSTGFAVMSCWESLLNTSTTQHFVWGWGTTPVAPFQNPGFHPVAQGLSIDIFMQWLDSHLNVIATVTSTGWSWDSINMAWGLAAIAASQTFNINQPVLAGLQSTYKNTP